MNAGANFTLFAVGFLLLGPSFVEASFIRLVSEFSVAPVPGQQGVFRFSGSVLNEGDETAHQVMLEFVKSGEIISHLEDLGTHEKRSFDLLVEGEKLGLAREGSYLIPVRAHYHDANGANFSSAYLVSLFTSEAASRGRRLSPVSVSLDPSVYENGGLEVFKEKELDLTLTNLSDKRVDVEVLFVASREVLFRPAGFSPLALAPFEKKDLSTDVINHAGLAGSSYATYVLVEGVANERHFSEHVSFVVKIVPPGEGIYLEWLFLGLALLFVAGGLSYWCLGRKSSRPKNC